MMAQGAKPKKIKKPEKMQFGEPEPLTPAEIMRMLNTEGTVNG